MKFESAEFGGTWAGDQNVGDRSQMLVRIFLVLEVAEQLRVSPSYVRARLRDRTFSGLKIAGRWAMTEAQIEQAIASLSTEALPAAPASPSGLSKNSRFRRRLSDNR